MLREKLNRVARHWASISLFGGFVFDFLTLWRIDLIWEDLIFLVYLTIAAIGITYLSIFEADLAKGKWGERFNLIFLIVLQFVFGGLFGRFFIFYSRSGSLAASWPFLIFLASLFILNERLKKNYLLFTYRMSVFFIALFSFAIFYLPILTGEMSPTMFIASGLASIAVLAGLVYGQVAILPKLRDHIKILVWSVAGIYIAINVMYFTNIIPPIPLSIQDAGVYHQVNRTGGQYSGLHEHQPWYKFFQRYEPIHLAPGEPVYVFSAVFAPTKINTTVIHEWQYYDPAKDTWVTASRIPFAINGGRDGGYRGFSYKTATHPARWRVNIKTERNQLIGRIKFEIFNVDAKPILETKTL